MLIVRILFAKYFVKSVNNDRRHPIERSRIFSVRAPEIKHDILLIKIFIHILYTDRAEMFDGNRIYLGLTLLFSLN